MPVKNVSSKGKDVLRRLVLILAFLFSAIPAGAPAFADAAASPPGIRGVAEGAVTVSGGHIDDAATIARLGTVHANTYDYLVENATQWADLPGFLTAADAAGIKVFAYLISPSECDATCQAALPYGADYVAWGADLNSLAAQHGSLVAWAVDDMDHNLGLFDSSYVKSMIEAAPRLKFYLQFYQPNITADLLSKYPDAAGLIMPFRDGADTDTEWTDTLSSAISSVTAELGSKPLIVMLYANTLGLSMLSPDADYVRAATSAAVSALDAGRIAGVIEWKLMLDPTGTPATLSEDPRFHAQTHGGIGALDFTLGDHTPTKAKDYAQAATTVTLDPGSSTCTLALYRIDDRPTTAPVGYHDKQVYVGDDLVWHEDVAADGTDWYSSSWLDLTNYLVNGVGTLKFRLTELSGVTNYETRVDFDDLRLTGCSVENPGFESDAGWTLSRNAGSPIGASVHQDSPTFTTDAFDAVAPLFAS